MTTEEYVKTRLRQIEKMDPLEKEAYFSSVRDLSVKEFNVKDIKLGLPLLRLIYTLLGNLEINIQNIDNLPKNERLLFAVNHSNKYDLFVAHEIMRRLGRDVSIMIGSDDLKKSVADMFRASGDILFDRNDPYERKCSMLDASSRLVTLGSDILVFIEGSWNLHPSRLMQPGHTGIEQIAAITGARIVPIIFDYEESKKIVLSEKDLIHKVNIIFGTPIEIDKTEKLIPQSGKVQTDMESMREKALEARGEYHSSLESLSKEDLIKYLIFTGLKINAFGFKLDPVSESKYLYGDRVNVHIVDEEGKPIPGELTKDGHKRVIDAYKKADGDVEKIDFKTLHLGKKQ